MKWRSWRSKVFCPGPKADPWILKGRCATGQAGLKTSAEGSEELKGAENEKQGSKMEVDEATKSTVPNTCKTHASRLVENVRHTVRGRLLVGGLSSHDVSGLCVNPLEQRLPGGIQAQGVSDTAADAGLVSCSRVGQLPVTRTRPDVNHINKKRPGHTILYKIITVTALLLLN